MYKVFDSLGKFVKSFPTYKEAIVFKYGLGNSGWYITQRNH